MLAPRRPVDGLALASGLLQYGEARVKASRIGRNAGFAPKAELTFGVHNRNFHRFAVRAVRATPVEVPLNFVLGTSAGVLRQVPLLLVDVETEEGVTGRGYLFCYLRAAQPAIVSVWRDRGADQGPAARSARRCSPN